MTDEMMTLRELVENRSTMFAATISQDAPPAAEGADANELDLSVQRNDRCLRRHRRAMAEHSNFACPIAAGRRGEAAMEAAATPSAGSYRSYTRNEISAYRPYRRRYD